MFSSKIFYVLGNHARMFANLDVGSQLQHSVRQRRELLMTENVENVEDTEDAYDEDDIDVGGPSEMH